MTSTAIVAYLALFATTGFLFVLASLLLGKVLRAHLPTAEKVRTYECGEPAIGSASVQFDLRFYVVALLFLIFEVEVAFFFPPATVFGKATHLLAESAQPAVGNDSREAKGTEEVFGIKSSIVVESMPKTSSVPERFELFSANVLTPSSASALAFGALCDVGVFFVVLLVGFAYLWRCGDLEWVRAVGHPRTAAEDAAMVMQLRSDEDS